MKMKGEARIAGAGSTEDVPACFSFGIVLFINAAIWRKTTMEFFNQAITVLQTLVVAIGAGFGVLSTCWKVMVTITVRCVPD